MPTTPNLGLTHIEQNQSQKEVTANAAFDALDEAMNDTVDIDCSAGGTIAVSSADYTHNAELHLTGTPAAAFTLAVPNTKRLFAVRNDSGQDATVSAGAGAVTQTVPAEAMRILACNGADEINRASIGALADDPAPTLAADMDAAGKVFRRAVLEDYAETRTAPAISAGALTLDLANGNVFEVTLDQDVTSITVQNAPASGKAGSFTLIFRQDATGGRTVSWPASFEWEGAAPTVSSPANAVDVYTFLTTDGGATWYGFKGRQEQPPAIDADTLDGLDSTKFARLDQGNTYVGNQTVTNSGQATQFEVRRTDTPAAARVSAVLDFEDKDAAGAVVDALCRMNARLETITAGAVDGAFEFNTKRAGAGGIRMTIKNGVVVGNAGGGDQGFGTLNAQGVYDDGTLLTCYVIEAAQTGRVDRARWNATVGEARDIDTGEAIPRSEHEPAAAFAQRLNELDPEAFAAKWKTRGHLPSMPSPAEWEGAGNKMAVGELVQRLWETVELQAVHIDALTQRIKALEAK